MTNTFRLHVNVQIVQNEYSSQNLSVNEEIPIKVHSFREMAEILEAFHVLLEQYKDRSDAPKR